MSGASMAPNPQRRLIRFVPIADAALANIDTILKRWLPDGHRDGQEYVARNPTRADRRPGSFKVNLKTGAWADFATGARGGDMIALAAYIHKLNQKEAALQVASMLGIEPFAP